MAATNTQKWLRDHSRLLKASFDASGRIEHAVTKGANREHQILTTLDALLPNRARVEANVVVVDADDAQSPKFDGALVDRTLWPRIFADRDVAVVMVESVLAALETKSELNPDELNDIFSKSAGLRRMKSSQALPAVVAFAYECPNPNLTFVDFAVRFYRQKPLAPSMCCVLNQCVIGAGEHQAGTLVPVDHPGDASVPVLYRAAEDALLLFVYFLCRLITQGTQVAEQFQQYARPVFAGAAGFCFDDDFAEAIRHDPVTAKAARGCFLRQGRTPIEDCYERARRAVGLS